MGGDLDSYRGKRCYTCILYSRGKVCLDTGHQRPRLKLIDHLGLLLLQVVFDQLKACINLSIHETQGFMLQNKETSLLEELYPVAENSRSYIYTIAANK